MYKIITVNNARFALLIADGLTDHFDGRNFCVVTRGVLYWEIVLAESSRKKSSERLMSDMQQFAIGYLAALRVHSC